ncbi:MAG: molybdopterin-dependent oxidoreductase [Myxococcota bacterium]
MRTTTTTVCNRDCPDSCTLKVTLENERAVRLGGDPSDPITQGFICARTQRFLQRQYAPDRFVTPMIRKDGELRSASWASALDLAAEKLLAAKKEHGPASILHYKSGGSLGILKALSSVLFSNFGPVTVKRGDICSGAGEAAQHMDFGTVDSHAIEDLEHSRLIVVWGKNPHTSGVHLLPKLKAAKARGARILAIDPVRTRMAGLADHFIQVRPGADYAVAMAMARYLFENDAVPADIHDFCDNADVVRELAYQNTHEAWAQQADVPADELARFAQLYAETKPAALLVGWGLGRRRNGATTIRALDALGAISGNLGVPGGGVSYYFARRAAFDNDFGIDMPEAPRTLSETQLGQEILRAKAPPIEVAWVTAGNPVAMLPDSNTVRTAFERTFTIVVDTHPTDTTDVADIVFPTLTLLEDEDLLGAYGNHYLRASRPALKPPQGPRHELEIWQGIAARVGLTDVMKGSVGDWKRRATKRLAKAGVPLERIEKGPVQNPFVPTVLFEKKRFATASKKAQLLDQAPVPAAKTTADFPLTLLAVSTPDAQSSQWTTERPPGPAEVFVHPTAAAGFADGTEARLVSAIGEMRVTVRHDAQQRLDVAHMAKGGQLRDGRCANVLVQAIETDLGGGAAYYDEGVRLEAIR